MTMKSRLTGVGGLVAASLFILPALLAQGAKLIVTPDNVAQIQNLGAVNTPYSEYTPFITADEHYLFFQSNRPGGVNEAGDFDLWFAENQVTEGSPRFSAPANVGLPVNSGFFDGHPTLRKLPTGDYEMYFASFGEDGRPGPQLTNLYYTIQKEGKWSVPVPVVEVNTDFHDRMPSISQDGHYLFFSSDRPGGFGRDDIWVSEYDFAAKRWGKPRNAGRTINTPASEVTPAIHSDNITLYFSSDRSGGLGGYDVYVTQMLQDLSASGNDEESKWKRPTNLGKPYNSTFDDEYPTVVRNGNFMYFASNRENGQGSFDIYRARVPDFAKPEIVVTLKGRVKEKFSEKGIEANIRISDMDGERNFSTHQPDGLYSADLINKKQYKMTVTAPGYQPIEYIADLREVNTPVTIQKDFEMVRALALPKQINLTVLFVDEKNRTLKPAATYTLQPELKDETILPFKNGAGRLSIAAMSRYKKPEDALAALEKMSLTVSAALKGFDNLRETRNVGDLIRGPNGELLGDVELKLVMKAKGGDVEVVHTKGPGGLEAIVYFSTNVANRLNNEKASGLKNVVDLWNKQPHKYVYVYGHADSRGGPAYNMKLSRSRAAFVKKRLIQYGIPAEMIITKSFGSSRLASKDESTVDGRRKNRRAEIYFDASKDKKDGGEPEEMSAPIKEPVEPIAKPTKPAKKPIKKPAKKPAKKKPLPPEEVEPSESTKPAASQDDKIVPGAETGVLEKAKSSAKPVNTEPVAPAEPGTTNVAPNTEIRIK